MNKIVKRFIIITILLIVLLPLILIYFYFSLNNNGFCFEQQRFLSDEEKIDGAIRVVLAGMYKRDEKGNYYPNPEYNVGYLKPKKNGKYIIFSEDINNFKTENPNCCTLSDTYRDFRIHPDAKRFGLTSVFVTVKFKYKDINGEEKIDSATVPISNCGSYRLSINESLF
jgi:hypothetical protein